ncbi:MAG: hypothetical protein V2A56_01085 [bacterium]
MKARSTAILLAVLIFSISAQAQNLLEQRADTLAAKLETIRSAKQEVLAPSLLGDIEKAIDRVRKDLEKGKKPGKIASSLDEVDQSMREAIGIIRKGLEIFQPVLDARDDAIYAKAEEFAKDGWERAEKEFGGAVSNLEKGKDDKAKEQVAPLTKLYRDAEYNAIRNQLVIPTLQSLEETERSDVSKYAPETLKRARAHVAKAEIILSRNRYDVESAQDEINLTTYEIRHAKYLTEIARQLEGKKEGVESLMHQIESHFDAVASAIGYEAKYDNGMEAPTSDVASQLRDAVTGAGAENKKLRDQLKQQKTFADSIRVVHRALVDSMETLNDLYEMQLLKSEEMRAEKARLEQKVASILNRFTTKNAKAMVEGDDIVFELTGLKFAPGDAALAPGENSLLVQVADAVRQFPMHLTFLRGAPIPANASAEAVEKSRKQAHAVLDYLHAQNVLVVNESALTMAEGGKAPENVPAAKATMSDSTGAMKTETAAGDSMSSEEAKTDTTAVSAESKMVGPLQIVITKALIFD